MSDVLVRRAAPHEYDEAGRLTVAAYAVDGFESPDGNYASVLRDAADRAAHAELLVAVDRRGELVGTATYCPRSSRYAELAGPGEADLRMLGVAARVRGRGIGEALVRHTLHRGRAEGIERLVLSTAEYMTAAHRLYERLGFERAPERDWRPDPSILLRAYVSTL